MITAEQLAVYRACRRDGATDAQAIEVLLTAAEASVIELGTAWEHERRGYHGKWVSGSGVSHQSQPVRMPRRSPAARASSERAHALRAAPPSPPPDTVSPAVEERLQQHMLQVSAVAAAQARAEASKQVAAVKAEKDQQFHMMIEKVRTSHQQVAAAREAEEQKTARKKLVVHAGMYVAGAILLGVETAMGLPGITMVITALGPQLIQELVDWAKKLH